MPATPEDIARYTNDGIVVTSPTDPAVSQAIAADNIDAIDGALQEIEMFYDLPADAQAMLDERFSYLRQVGPIHLGIETAESIGLGDAIALVPTVPSFTVVDDDRGLSRVVRTRAYAHDMQTDRYSVEVVS